MLSKSIQAAMNTQIAQEAYASHYYLAMASWAEVKGYVNIAEFMYFHSKQEQAHMMKLFKYVNDAGAHALSPEVKAAPADYKDILNMFEQVLAQEISVSQSINALVDLCLKEKDYSSFNFLQWYVAEQHEEEKLFRNILDKIRIIGTDGRGLFWIDKEIKKLMPVAG